MTLEEKYDDLMNSYQSVSTTNHDLQRKMEEIEGKNVYLCKQLNKFKKQKQWVLESPIGSNLEQLSEAESQHSIYEEDEPRRLVCATRPPININSNNFRVDIPEFEGKLNP